MLYTTNILSHLCVFCSWILMRLVWRIPVHLLRCYNNAEVLHCFLAKWLIHHSILQQNKQLLTSSSCSSVHLSCILLFVLHWQGCSCRNFFSRSIRKLVQQISTDELRFINVKYGDRGLIICGSTSSQLPSENISQTWRHIKKKHCFYKIPLIKHHINYKIEKQVSQGILSQIFGIIYLDTHKF